MSVAAGLCIREPGLWHGRDLVSLVSLAVHLEAWWGDVESLCLDPKEFWSQACESCLQKL